MAKIEDLIGRIADESLRDAIAAEVKELKKTKRFGLVFEEHLPETVRLPNVAIRKGSLVAQKAESGNNAWIIRSIKKGLAECVPQGDPLHTPEIVSFPVTELVSVKPFGEPIFPTLTPIDRVSCGGKDKPWHTLINADNFHALQLLLYCYEGKVDLIYIDPPYNSGAKDWKYNNDFVDSSDSFRHSKWLSMMRKRIKLAEKLLSENGILVVTIDENEVDHLAILLRTTFPRHLHKRLSIVINPKGAGKKNFGRMEEYALFVIPDTGESEVHANYLPDLALKDESENDEAEAELEEAEEQVQLDIEAAEENWDMPFPTSEAGLWELRHARRRGNESSYRHQRWNQFYPIYIDTKKRIVVRAGESIPLTDEPDFRKKGGLIPVWPIDHEGNHRCWRFISKSMQERIDKSLVVLGKFNKNHQTWTINIWEKSAKRKLVKTVWWSPRHDAGTHGTTLLHELLGRRDAFPFAKSLYAVVDTLVTAIADKPNALVLDFFAGSGTTAHAVSLINSRFGGNRRAILVSNNEPGEKVASALKSEGTYPGDNHYESNGICESVTWPRCKAMITGERSDGNKLNGKYVGTTAAGETLLLRDGFAENMEYFRLDFLDPSEVERGDAFEGILPILWMMAGCVGEREDRRGSTSYYIAKHSPFAVLIREAHFSDFAEKLTNRPDINHAFLVTDSEENFALMRRELGSSIKCYQLYKNYLENFRLNSANPSLMGQNV